MASMRTKPQLSQFEPKHVAVNNL